ncbi:hypothetical protein GNF10_21000 [Nostoc sp. UCD121]|uniref:T3SS effector HopA1 family protein n=1 Tax=unclassified Nostoc TaxID=2593658 RepID=UPI0016260ABE|nr:MULTISPECIES: T3SS effector HopA1 family protein [unclassified Nostoc]MBC1225075.1 hypothetical protein [Nostoc sp. UCD120]MBC1278373.1 hypothetical protein [Nostoc sp. UCD121]
MQLLDFTQTQLETDVNKQLMNVLAEIAHKVEIQPNFSIQHPDYKPLELPSEIIERFQKTPKEIQQKYISLQLRSFLYGIYYNGSMQSALALDGERNNLALDLENNTFLGVDLAFYERLHQNNCGEGYFDAGWSVIKEESDGILVVTKNGLRLHIQRIKHLQSSEKAALIGDLVAIKMPKNLVQNGFYMAVSNVGLNRIADLNSQPVTVRIYFNLTPEGAVAVMNSLTKQLNAIAIPFSFKVLYNPDDYQRYDSGVLYFDQRDYPGVRKIVQQVYDEMQSHFQPEVPLFTKRLAPGLGLAEEPNQKFGSQESFGMNRCQIVTNGLLEAWYQGENSPEKRLKAIYKQFLLLSIDLQHPYLNANSTYIY